MAIFEGTFRQEPKNNPKYVPRNPRYSKDYKNSDPLQPEYFEVLVAEPNFSRVNSYGYQECDPKPSLRQFCECK
jgi:hypothetical protein